MPYILVEDFKAGLDTRRTNVTSVPGSLATLTNAHLTRGGEIEKRKAFVQLVTLPTDSDGNPATVGLAAGGGQIYVFGSLPSSVVNFPTGTPSNVNYVQLRHPECEASFRVSSDTGGGTVTRVVVDSVDILNANDGSGIVSSGGTQALTAEAIAEQINTYLSYTSGGNPEYVATSDGDKVIVRGAIAEGTTISVTTTTGINIGSIDDFKSIAITELLGSEFFDGFVYTAARFADGKIHHYWEGQNNPSVTPPNRIADWFDGRARAKFRITGGTAGGTAATGTITITAGTDNPGDNVRVIRVNGVQVNDSAVAHTGDNTTTATAVKNAINATTSVPNYTATSSGAVVTITASAVGTLYNGYVIEVENDGAVTTSQANLSGGVSNSISNITVDGEQIIENEVPWSTSNTYTATLVAKAINEYASAPEYEASTDGSIVNIISKEGGIAYNSKAVVITKAGDVTFDQYGLTTLDGGADASTLAGYSPGGYVLTVKSKMHSVSDSLWHFSAIDKPYEWNATASPDFAGFVNLSNNARGSEDLKAIANYYSNLAIFAEQAVQIWFVDPNPANLQQIQVLHNTGTIAANSVVEFGDSDVFYLDSSGIRSLKARDSSNAAFVEDIGNPIDSLIQEEIQTNLDASRKAVGILSPKDGRYLLAIGTKVYVFSYYPSSKISAWSVYEPGFTIQHWAYDGDQMLCRGDDNKLYSLGGANNTTYDNSTVTVQLPFLDGGKPATSKDFYGLDAVVENDWDVYVSTDPTDISSNEQIGTIDRTTYGLGRVTMTGYSTHLAVKMVCSKSGSAKIGNLAVHYEQAEAG
tara:strand:+ start:18545 stop:20977 length:2433 start_codon:yes stop_codon:yes gene_type:complete